jgi:two-component system chemotaxis sensor kinase CheA
MSEAEAEFLELFRHEANDRLDNMVNVLRGLESGDAVPEALDSLFRDAHTIRGGAGMLGLDDASTLAYAIEDVLGSARKAGELPLRLIDPLLRASDALRSQVAGEGEGATGLLEELAGPW